MATYYKAIHSTRFPDFRKHQKPGFMTTDLGVAYAYVAPFLHLINDDDKVYLLRVDVPEAILEQLTELEGVDMCFLRDKRSYPVGCYSTVAASAYRHGGLDTIVLNVPVSKWEIVSCYNDRAELDKDWEVLNASPRI